MKMFVSVTAVVTVVDIIQIVSINLHVKVTTIATLWTSLGSTSQVPLSAVLLLPIQLATRHMIYLLTYSMVQSPS